MAYRVTVLVLGDVGRSPRMANHALALAEDGAEVALVGYCESPLDGAVAGHPRIRVVAIKPLGRAGPGASRLQFLLRASLRSGYLLLQTLWALLARTRRPSAVLVQNPPSVPTLLVAWVSARVRGASFVIDWHNFGYSMLALRLGSSHIAVRLSKIWEGTLGRRADVHFCVSEAMRDALAREFGLAGPIVLYDRPRVYPPLVPMSARGGFALAVCPTSWTADEDMDLLLEGLRLWDAGPARGPRLVVVITGRGPRRAAFEARLAGIEWRRVEVRTAFLEPGEYRVLLGSAHFGISMHRSSSGVDLPMKVVDLFGARTPVCALDYGPCIAEQVLAGVTGVLFRDAAGLAACIERLLDVRALEEMQANIAARWTETWGEAWRRLARPVFGQAGTPAQH